MDADKSAILERWAWSISPLPNATILLMQLGNKAMMHRFRPGDEPNWKEVLVHLLAANEHITVDEIFKNLRGHPRESER